MDIPPNGAPAPACSLTEIFRQRFPLTEDLFFVQVGANDGRTNDPIFDLVSGSSWRGLLIEPVPILFNMLRENYKDKSGLILENCAINDKPGIKNIYTLEYKDNYFQQIFSLLPESLELNRDQVAETYNCDPGAVNVIGGPIWCETFDSLFTKHAVEKVDFLLMDVEGYEWRLIQNYDFQRFRPRLIALEETHLSLADRQACRDYLTGLGYRVYNADDNLVAE